MYHYTKEQNDKQHFVIYLLEDLLHFANKDIHGAKFIADEQAEFVKIKMSNGTKYNINVTGDNMMALAKDVINFMIRK